jgi:hypothetical protein
MHASARRKVRPNPIPLSYSTNRPSGLLLDHVCRLRVLPGGAACIGGAGRGVLLMGTRLGAPQSNAWYCELRRLTMRGELRLMVRLARRLTLA